MPCKNHTNEGYRRLKAKVGGRRFTIYDILRVGTPPDEIRKLTALIQSLMFIGRAKRVKKIMVVTPVRKKWINQYMLL